MTVWNFETLPLLPTFQALMEHASVSRAAGALGLTQSAVSKHLAKLRSAYGDPLFVRTPDGMQPTPHAIWMQPHVAAILTEARALNETRSFDPGQQTGEVTISTTDQIRWMLVPKLLARFEDEAPNLRLNIRPLEQDYSHHHLETGKTDLVVGVNWHAPEGLKQSRMFSDRFICLLGAENPLAQGDMTVEAYAAAPHIMVAPLGMRHSAVDDVLAQKDLRRFVSLSVPDFHQLGPEVLGNRRIVTLPSRVAEFLVSRYPGQLVLRPTPIYLPEFSYFEMWHIRFDRDPRHMWLRHAVRHVLRQAPDNSFHQLP